MDNNTIKDADRETQYKNIMEALGTGEVKPHVESNALKASKMRFIINSHYFRKVYQNKSKVAYTGEAFPNELIFAFKMAPLNLEMMAALLAQTDIINDYTKLTDEYNVSRDMCSHVRSTMGVALGNCYPRPDLVLTNSFPCDGISKLYYLVSKLYRRKFLILDTPNYVNDDSISFLVIQMKNVIKEIEKELNLKFKEEELIKVINYSNQAKEYFYKTCRLCQTAKLPLVPRELMELVVANFWGLKELVNICKTLYEEALEMSRKPGNKKKGKRILWIGLLPYYSNPLTKYIEEECRLEILYLTSFDNLGFLLDPEKPLRSLAKKLIIYSWDPLRLRNNLADICEKFAVDGFVLLNVWGCRNMLGITHMLRDMTTGNNLKFLALDGDYLDKNKFSFSQLKNRLDAFVEIVNEG